jgi:nitric oxide reductase subunit B
MSFATAGIAQTYLERIMGLGFMETQLKIQVHFLMLMGTATIFVTGVGLFLFDFFRSMPVRRPPDDAPEQVVLQVAGV